MLRSCMPFLACKSQRLHACIRYLLLLPRCSEGLTAEDYAKRAGHAAIAAYFGRGAESSEESAGEEEEEGEMIEGESATQRRCGSS